MIEMFEDAEKEFWTLKIKGINYWHIVRMSVFELVQGKGEHIGQAHPDHNLKMSFKEKVRVGFMFLVNSLFRHPLVRFKKRKIILLFVFRERLCIKVDIYVQQWNLY